jgi:hypothetical protein
MQTDALPAVPSTALFAVVGEDGWESPDNPPGNDRVVQIAWDDMSASENSLGFYDGIAEIPDSGKRYWWTHPRMTQHDKSAIGAWRDIPANKQVSNQREMPKFCK